MVCLLRVPDSNFIKKTNLCVTPGRGPGMGKYRHESIVTDGTETSPYPDTGPGMRICLYRWLQESVVSDSTDTSSYQDIGPAMRKYLHRSLKALRRRYFPIPGRMTGDGEISAWIRWNRQYRYFPMATSWPCRSFLAPIAKLRYFFTMTADLHCGEISASCSQRLAMPMFPLPEAGHTDISSQAFTVRTPVLGLNVWIFKLKTTNSWSTLNTT